jgi:hypothetical protein
VFFSLALLLCALFLTTRDDGLGSHHGRNKRLDLEGYPLVQVSNNFCFSFFFFLRFVFLQYVGITTPKNYPASQVIEKQAW